MPITASHTVKLPSSADMSSTMTSLADISSSSALGMFPANLFPELSGSRYGFAPNNNSFCLFHVPKDGGKTPMMPMPMHGGMYGYGPAHGTPGQPALPVSPDGWFCIVWL